MQTLSSLPEDFQKPNSCAHLEITPSGRFLYAANRGHDSLAGYAVDAETGILTSLGQTSTEATPRSFNISPNGKFLYAAGQSSGKLAAYRLNSKTGELTRFATYSVGERPWWVLVVELPN
jgi:6-phosphogluconolactonase